MSPFHAAAILFLLAAQYFPSCSAWSECINGVCLSSDPPLFFVDFASFIVLFAVVFFAVWIYAVVRGCRQGARREEKPPAYVLLPSAGHDAELEFDLAEEGEGDVKARHVQAMA
ncbi:hypothetical protein DFH08DRAFT_930885 [Mycena albidolilacea]|uniref:Uncharacterized protein n=1 Tax=Mycena albidolilacea TaxID=1033008 RepID=A0AAD7F2A1_9AGAR|nr:hypothetical protein DFH08DRAFT_930885 [Mycena albidolilacea]